MRLDFAMWGKALQVIPRISKEKWDRLDVISRWLIATRAAVLIMTFLRRILPLFRQPKPAEKPADFPDVWPKYFVAAGFYHNRLFGLWFLLGLLVNAALVVLGR
jgi:hypothetical protein